MMSISLSNTATLNIKSSDYHCIVSLISKNEATNLLQNADWTEKWEHYKKKKKSFWKYMWKWKKTIIKLDDVEIKKNKKTST